MISLFRKLQYEQISKLKIDGKVIDLGGSRISGYHELIKGDHEFIVANLSDYYGFDVKVDLEKKFPFEDETFDNAIAINLIEHIYDYKNIFSEAHRIIKKSGVFAFTSPFMFHKHGCPSDYNRFTDDALKKIAIEAGFEVVEVVELGEGVFSAFYQMLPLPYILRYIFQDIFVYADIIFKKLSKGYNKISHEYPLGYYVVLRK
jgi:SAM-dependent methyltransferase